MSSRLETNQTVQNLTSPILRLLSVAVADGQFRQLLLCDPLKAIEAGYGGEQFLLSDAEKDKILNVAYASSLAEFVQQLVALQPLKQYEERNRVS